VAYRTPGDIERNVGGKARNSVKVAGDGRVDRPAD